jgi:hypothetical protein
MDLRGNPLATRPIQTGWGYSMEPYRSGQFGFIDDPDRQFGNGSVWTQTRTRSGSPEPLLTLPVPLNTLQSLPSSNLISCATASTSCQSSIDPYNLSSDDEQYLTSENMAETIPGWSDNAAHLWASGWLYFHQPPETPKNWGEINPNLDDYHSDPTEFINTLWILDITDWWHQQEETHSRNTNLSNVAGDIFSIIPHGV